MIGIGLVGSGGRASDIDAPLVCCEDAFQQLVDIMNSLLDRARKQTTVLQDELRRQIAFIESETRINVPEGELSRLKMQLAEHDVLVERYTTHLGSC